MDINISKLNKTFGSKKVLRDVYLTIPSGAMVGLVGPNGAGKTTLIRCMMNIDAGYSGDVYFGGVSNQDVGVFQKVSLLHESRVLYPHLTAKDHLKFLVGIYKLPDSRIEQVVEEVGIQAYLHQKVGTYSLGMKQHLLLCMAIINQPKCLIMDEPFNGLDPSSVIRLKTMLRKLNDEGVTILLSSHILGPLQDLTDRVYLVKGGKVEDVKLDEQEQTMHTITLPDPKRLLPFFDQRKSSFELNEDSIRFTGDLTKLINYLSENGIHIDSISSDRTSLEEVYMAHYDLKK